MTGRRSLPQILGAIRHLFLEFDGPICSIFAGVSAHAIADQLRRRLLSAGIDLPGDTFATPDPLEVLRDAATLGRDAAWRAHAELTDLEVAAVATARPTPGAAELIKAADRTGRTVTIVSNNSVEAILAYLDAHDTPAHIRTIYGREDADPAHMKPHPYQIHRAVSGLPYGVSPGQCAVIGESTSDVTAGHLARAVVIGYASEPSKIDLLRAAEADAITADLAEITIALHNTPIAE